METPLLPQIYSGSCSIYSQEKQRKTENWTFSTRSSCPAQVLAFSLPCHDQDNTYQSQPNHAVHSTAEHETKDSAVGVEESATPSGLSQFLLASIHSESYSSERSSFLPTPHCITAVQPDHLLLLLIRNCGAYLHPDADTIVGLVDALELGDVVLAVEEAARN